MNRTSWYGSSWILHRIPRENPLHAPPIHIPRFANNRGTPHSHGPSDGEFPRGELDERGDEEFPRQADVGRGGKSELGALIASPSVEFAILGDDHRGVEAAADLLDELTRIQNKKRNVHR